MKLKPVVVSMMLLGLTAPAFADDASTQSQIDAMKAQLDKMEAVINQNGAGGFQQPMGWSNRITVSGMANMDFSQSNTTPNFGANTSSGNSNSLTLNNANLFVDAVVNDWTKAHIGLLYQDADNRTAAFYRDQTNSVSGTKDVLDEAYVTIGNFSQNPFFFRAGKEYVPFGVYQRFPMVVNPTQLLSETQATTAQVGFVTQMGFYGSAYGFRGLQSSSEPTITIDGVDTGETGRPRVANYGVDFGYANQGANWGTKLDASYLDNMSDVNYISQNIGSYNKRVHGLSLSAQGNIASFDAKADYVTALSNFSSADVITTSDSGASYSGAKPSAIGLDAGYSFPVLAHPTRVGVGYQHTQDAATTPISVGGVTLDGGVGGFGLPQNRYYADYTFNISKWTDMGVEIYHDRDYSLSQGGTGRSATTGVVRLGVKFA